MEAERYLDIDQPILSVLGCFCSAEHELLFRLVTKIEVNNFFNSKEELKTILHFATRKHFQYKVKKSDKG